MVVEEVCSLLEANEFSEQVISSEKRRTAWQALLLDGLTAKHFEAEDLYRSLGRIPCSYDDVIQRDVGRTLPHEQLFRDRCGKGQSALFRLLHALAVNHADIGYVQSLNFIVATLINVFPDDEPLVFSCAQSLLFRHTLADFYRPSFPKLGVAIWQFDRLVEGFLPKAHAALDAHGITAEFYAMEWFLTLFASDLPQKVAVQVWDRFLLFGWQVIAQVALALVADIEDELSNLEDSCEAMTLLKRFTHKRRFKAQPLLDASSKFDVSHRMLSDLEAAHSRGEDAEGTRLVVDKDAETGALRWSVQRDAPPKMRRSPSNHSIGSTAEPLPRAFDRKDSQSSVGAGSLRSSLSSTHEGTDSVKVSGNTTLLPFLIHNLDTGETTLLEDEWTEYTSERELGRLQTPAPELSPTLLGRFSSRAALPASPITKFTGEGACGGSFWVQVQQEQALRALGKA